MVNMQCLKQNATQAQPLLANRMKKKILPSNYKVSRLVPEYRQGYIQEHWNIIQAASELTLLYLTRKHAVQLAK